MYNTPRSDVQYAEIRCTNAEIRCTIRREQGREGPRQSEAKTRGKVDKAPTHAQLLAALHVACTWLTLASQHGRSSRTSLSKRPFAEAASCALSSAPVSLRGVSSWLGLCLPTRARSVGALAAYASSKYCNTPRLIHNKPRSCTKQCA